MDIFYIYPTTTVMLQLVILEHSEYGVQFMK